MNELSSLYLISLFFVCLVGACIGSFINMVTYRVPQNISILFPRSHCPSCKTPIGILGLLPIFGFFFLKGKCPRCQFKIPFKYPLVEALCAAGTVFIFLKHVDPDKIILLLSQSHIDIQQLVALLMALWLFWSGVCLSIIDIEHRILPDIITIPGIFVGLFLNSFDKNIGFIPALLGALVGGGGLWLLRKIYMLLRHKEGMGLGDVKYLALLGASLGTIGVIHTLFLSCILGSVIGILYGIYRKQGLNVAIPFGPFLAAGAFFTHWFQWT